MLFSNNQKKIQYCFEILLTALLLAIIGIFICANIFHYTAYIESDTGAEAVYGMVLAQNKLISPKTWVASTENRIISMPNIAAVFYLITGNMNFSSGISSSIFLIVLIFLNVILWRNLGFNRISTIVATLIPLIITVNVLFGLKMYALYACYYSPHLIALFCLMLFYYHLLNEKTISKLVSILLVLYSFLLGMQGLRALSMVFIPLCMAELLRMAISIFDLVKHGKSIRSIYSKIKPILWIYGLTTVNAIAAKLFAPFGSETSSNFRKGIFKLANTVIPETVELLQREGIAGIFVIILAIIALLGWIIILVKFETSKKVVLLTIPLSLIFAECAASFSTLDSSPRYYIMIVFLIAAGDGAFVNYLFKMAVKGKNIVFFVLISVIVLTVNTINENYNNLIKKDCSDCADELAIVNELLAKGYSIGYASFDYAHVFTSYANGKIVVAPITLETLTPVEWLTDMSWYPPYVDENEPCFIIATEYSLESLVQSIHDKGIESYEKWQVGTYTVVELDRALPYNK